MDFHETEQTLFKHKAKIKLVPIKIQGSSNTAVATLLKEGDLIITSIRVVFVFYDSTEPVVFVWANILDIKYAKGRPIIGIKTVISQFDDILITLLGSTAESEVAKLRILLEPLLKSKSSKLPQSQPSFSSSSGAGLSGDHSTTTRATKSQNIIRQATQNHEKEQLLLLQQKKLLATNQLLAKQFHELVELSKVISESDFWESHASFLEEWSSADGTNALLTKGKDNNLLVNILEKNAEGKPVVSLNPEKKQNIFIMYPEVYRAFEAEVPLRMQETDFWTRYFNNEIYNSSGSFSISSGKSSDHVPSSFRPKDELFSKYADNSDASKAQSSSSGNHRQERLTNISHSDVDLTASFADHRESFSSSETVIDEPLSSRGNDELIATAAGVAKRAAQLSTKLNKNSSLVVMSGQDRSICEDKNSSVLLTAQSSLHELEQRPKPVYIPITMRYDTHAHAEDDNRRPSSVIKQESLGNLSDLQAEEPSAFAVSSSRIRRSIDDPVAAATTIGGAFTTASPAAVPSTRVEPLTSELLLSSLGSLLLDVDAERTKKVFQGELNKVKKAVGSAFFGDLGGKRKRDSSAATDEADDRDTERCSEQFKQEMLEMYTDITELLRHFYAILRRTGSQSVSCNATAAAKAEGIVQRLVEDKGGRLESKKRRIVAEATEKTGSRTDVESALVIVNEMLQLIQQAKISWTIYTSSS